MTANKAQELLRQNGVRASIIRVSVLTYLLSHPTHPTADEIYQALRVKILTLSKTSVYNTLTLLAAKKIVNVITIDDKETRYDANIKEHGHFQCQDCGQIYDFSITLNKAETQGLTGFQVEARNVFYYGRCSKCQKKKKKKKKSS